MNYLASEEGFDAPKLPRGEKIIGDLVREKDGDKMIEYMATTKGGQKMGGMMAGVSGGGTSE